MKSCVSTIILPVVKFSGQSGFWCREDIFREVMQVLRHPKSVREAFTDLAATIANVMGVERPLVRQSFKNRIRKTLNHISGQPLLDWIKQDPKRVATQNMWPALSPEK